MALASVQLRQQAVMNASARYRRWKRAMRRSLRATRSGTCGPGREGIGHLSMVRCTANARLTGPVGSVINREEERR